MANSEHLAHLRRGVENWNKWREENPNIAPDLSDAHLEQAKLIKAYLSWANLRRAILTRATLNGANLARANLRGANLQQANLHHATLRVANLHKAILIETDLRLANLRRANLTGADLRRADLRRASLINTKLEDADLSGCNIYGISAWNVNLTGTTQSNLRITPENEAAIHVDNLEVAQFIYLLLNNERVRQVIDTITSKVVLILGRFTPERKVILDALRDELRSRNYTPVLFDFEKSDNRNLTETVSTIAHMARFVIADITDAKSIPQELERIVPRLSTVAVQPLLLASQEEYGMFYDFLDYPWVLQPFRYKDQPELLAGIQTKVIVPAEQKVEELIRKRADRQHGQR